jgi:hypothetical protein
MLCNLARGIACWNHVHIVILFSPVQVRIFILHNYFSSSSSSSSSINSGAGGSNSSKCLLLAVFNNMLLLSGPDQDRWAPRQANNLAPLQTGIL